jgi:lysozyme
MKISRAGLDFIKGFETLQLIGMLPTPNDVPTAGWGHTGPDVTLGTKYSLAQCDAWLIGDLAQAEDGVNRLVKVPLTQGQFDALVSLVFNIGVGNFGSSTLRKLLNAGDYAGAAAQFDRWNKQAGKVLNGLTRRRAGERAMFEGK